MGIINNDFLLKTNTAKKLYHEFAEELPIIDYHCHLSPKMIAEDHRFTDAYDLFLGGDHYKWRQMRTFGIDEEYITGNADRYEKWLGFCRIMPYLIGNPLYHWTALELKRYFDIDEPLSEKNAEEVWSLCNKYLKHKDFSAQGLIKRSNVEVICTTDDPCDDLKYHRQLREQGFPTKVLPTFRPDKIINIEKPEFIPYLHQNGINSYSEAKSLIIERIKYFNLNGCRLSDHALEYVPFATGNAEEAFNKKINGIALTKAEIDIYKTEMLSICAAEYTRLGWAMQLHIGALRNNNSRMLKKLGPDTGFDSVNDLCIAEKLAAFMDYLNSNDILPKTILYTLNPKDNYVLGTMLGNFQCGPCASKIQFGSAWWFNDNISGMTAQMDALANLGMLGKFIGMLTDSRSFISYSRHEYFRRILCNMLGSWVEDGLYPNDAQSLKAIIEGVCYKNAKEYFNFQ